MIVYRTERKSRQGDWPSEGYKYVSGRWNEVGMPVIYTSENASLAMLETLANSEILPKNRLLLEIEIHPSVKIHIPNPRSFPVDWNATPFPEENWLFMKKLLKDHGCIKVPTIQTPNEFNYLLHAHVPEFKKLFKILRTIPIPFNPRLML